VVDLIGNKADATRPAERGDRRQLGTLQHGAGRIRRTRHDQAVNWRRHRLQHRDGRLEVARRIEADPDHFDAKRAQDVLVGGESGLRHDHAVARIEHREKAQHERARGAYRDHDALGIDREVVAAPVVLGDGGAERGAAQSLGIADPSALESTPRRGQHGPRRTATGLANLEMDHVAPGGRVPIGARQHVHGDERRDLAARRDLQPIAQRSSSHLLLNVHICTEGSVTTEAAPPDLWSEIDGARRGGASPSRAARVQCT
jgi:hypothetical protein